MRPDTFTTQHRACRGGALVSLLVLLVGVILGALVIVGLSIFNIDVAGMILPKSSKETAPIPSAKPMEIDSAQDKEMAKLIAELKQAREQLNEGHLGLERRRLQQERETLDGLRIKIDAAEKALKDKFRKLEQDKANSNRSAQGPLTADELKAQQEREANTKRIAKMWSQLDAAEVPKVAQSVDDDFAAEVLFSMSERNAGPILSAIAAAEQAGPQRVATIMQKIRDLRKRVENKQKENPQ